MEAYYPKQSKRPFASRDTIRVVINTMSVHREGVEPNSVDGPDHHHDHIAHKYFVSGWKPRLGNQIIRHLSTESTRETTPQ